ncbi:Uncharacterised protein [Mycolicibacterium phlei]|uniref:hypothetical protein n=1 Tax=Mycobacteroides chelonae TaxID=1774 RepID=UPI000618C07F|nr:hypothetical protein [Mycobacteroides chelonae]VEG14544.1 Uncharacterised protein [Mycolicibacterium phlei]AKC37577.1 hypothetical protein GR01_01970 [Mycobacteroides chelonae]ANB00779.1 hypothetical protein BB28_02010 [Mycobacteroides chelonae CCUG 47445]OLT81235.1 hypothetical protein BKG56_03000 [Mycobacteroides chelonae]ORV17265.1 hypothetical protein AWB96_03285 [Mycobacteroides chelonae]
MSDTTPSEDDYRRLSVRIREDVNQLQRVPIQGAITSPIEIDNQYLRTGPVSQSIQELVRVPLESAIDNLSLVADMLNTIGAQHLYAENSLIRTSLTGASFALWMLNDSDANVRRARVLRFAFKNIDGLTSYFTGNADMNPKFFEEMNSYQELIVKQANVLEREERSVTKYRNYRPDDTDPTKIWYSDTAVVRYAGDVIEAPNLLSTWQFMSGYAHSLPWSILVNSLETAHRIERYGAVMPRHEPNPRQLLSASNLALAVIEKTTECLVALSRPGSAAPLH